MFKRSLGYPLMTLWLLIGALLVTACVAPVAAPAGDTAADSSAPTTITWSVWGSAAELASHEAVAEAFMATHPELAIEIQHTPWDGYHEKLRTLVASGDRTQLADVMFLAQDYNRYAEEGILEPLDAYVAATGYDLSDYWPTVIDNATIDGKLYGLQRDLDLRLLYYNKDRFDAAGVAYPTDAWSWDDWAAAATALTVVDANGRVSQQGLGMETGKWGMLLAQAGGAYLDDPRNPSQCALDTPASMQAIQFYAALLDSNAAMRPGNLSQIGGDAGAFLQGQVAMIVQNSSRAPSFNEAGLNYDVAPIPIPEGGRRVNNVGGARFVMNAASTNKEAAWTFLSWLQGPEGGQQIYTERGEMFPVLASVANSPAFLAAAQQPANRQAFIVEASNVQLFTNGDFPEFSELNDLIIEPNLQRIWVGEAAPADVIPTLCESVNAFLAENNYPR